ncbi:MAG: hypothetical protein H6809_04725 [Phycisphaeraceae bacterium]|nr:hypothetical protein [Phycisphaeraceae bacterium]
MRPLRGAILLLALLSLAATLAALGLWAVNLLVSDRALWAQRLSFVPRQFLVWPAGVGWVSFAILSLLFQWLRPAARFVPWSSERRRRTLLPRLLGGARAGVGLIVLAVTLHLVVLEWRWPLNIARAAPPPEERLRIVHWNIGWSEPREVFDSIEARRPDLAIVVNPLTRQEWPWDFDDLQSRLGAEGGMIRTWPINVLSRWPIKRWGVTELGFSSRVSVVEELRDAQTEPPLDPGRAMYVELEVGAPLNRSVVVWIIDLPSEPGLHRLRVARQARERISMWLGPDEETFPEPDVLIGDFNIPRGSASMWTLRRRPGYLMADAHDQGGLGPSPSWPASRPLLHIDQCFLAPGLRAARYAIEDGGDTRHRMQVVDIVPD